MKTLLLIAAMPLLAQQRLSSPVAIGGANCGEIQLRKQFPNSAQYMAWRNCENVGEMSMELVNNANDLKARFSNSGSGTLTLFNSSSQIGLFASGLGSISGYASNIERVRLTSNNPILDLKNTSGVNIVRVDGTGTGGLFTSAGTEVTLSQTGDSLGGMQFICRNRFAQNGCIINNPSLDLADFIFTTSTGATRTMRFEPRSGSSLTYLEAAPEFQFGDMSSYPGGIGLMANTNGAGVYKGDYFQWMGGTSGYLRWSAPSTVTSYALTWPGAAGSTGDCFKRGSGTTTEWGTCGSGGGGVDLTSAQDISGIKYATISFRAAELAVRSSSSAGNLWQTFISSGSPVTQYYPSTSGTPSIDIIGNRSSTSTGAIIFYDQSSNQTLNINGGSSSSFPSISLNTSTGSMVDIRYGGSLTGGSFKVFTNSGFEAVNIDGTGNGRIRVSNGSTMQTGFTGTVNFSACTAGTVVMGIYISGC